MTKEVDNGLCRMVYTKQTPRLHTSQGAIRGGKWGGGVKPRGRGQGRGRGCGRGAPPRQQGVQG